MYPRCWGFDYLGKIDSKEWYIWFEGRYIFYFSSVTRLRYIMVAAILSCSGFLLPPRKTPTVLAAKHTASSFPREALI